MCYGEVPKRCLISFVHLAFCGLAPYNIAYKAYGVVKTKTIKELSDALKISRVSLYRLLKRDDISNHVFKRDGVSMVDEAGEALIRSYYNKEQAATVDDIVNDTVNETFNDRVQGANADIISLLQGQLKEKDMQINALLNIVANAQKLQATQLLTDNSSVPAPEPAIKKSLFNRLFKKDKL